MQCLDKVAVMPLCMVIATIQTSVTGKKCVVLKVYNEPVSKLPLRISRPVDACLNLSIDLLNFRIISKTMQSVYNRCAML